MVTICTPTAAKSTSSDCTSSGVSPRPSMNPDFVTSPARLARANTDKLRA